MPDTARRWTAQMVRDLPDDGNRYECVEGVLLVTPSPRVPHQLVLSRIHGCLARHLRGARPRQAVLESPAEITWGEEDHYIQPDLFVVPESELRGGWTDVRQLVLAVEVISPSSRRADRVVKRLAYQRHGVATYWVVDPEARVVEVWHPEDDVPELVTGTLRWRFAPDVPELALDLAEIWRAVE